jgi:hypothetical protein
MTGKEGSGPAIGRVLDALTIAGGHDGRGEYLAFCPAHDDKKTPNLRLREAEDGRVLLRCFAGCDQDEILSALTEKGIGKSDLFAKNGRGGGRGATTSRDHVHACTLEAYAGAKRLPVEFLARLGLSDTSYVGKPAVRVPYLKEDGSEGAVRFRIALEKGPKGDERFRWRKGSKPSPYGLWRLEHARERGYIFLVEGESDAQTFWHHGHESRFGVFVSTADHFTTAAIEARTRAERLGMRLELYDRGKLNNLIGGLLPTRPWLDAVEYMAPERLEWFRDALPKLEPTMCKLDLEEEA